MTEVELRRELKVLIAEIIEVDDFNDDDNFVSQLDVDSMLALEIVARIERRYHIRIPEECFAQLLTLNAVVQIVEEIMQPVKS
ncbi:MAG: acyl carrier protein [Ktedonobacteraceae bacterium]|nr:acyl carrier protein [Chloroflexota bacterium]